MVILADRKSDSWEFAEKVQNYIKETKKVEIPVKEVSIEFFRNEEINMEVPENVRRKEVYFIHDSNKYPQDWWVELLLLKDLLLSASAERVNFVLPNMLYGRKDWKDRPHVPISARALAESIAPGLKRIITMDLHAAQGQSIYPSYLPIDNLSSFPAVCNYIKERPSDFGEIEKLVVVAPDVSGAKRVAKFAKKSNSQYPIAVIDKRRHPITGEILSVNLIGDVKDKNCLMLDDLVDSGGTLIEGGDCLKENGAKEMFCYTTHGLYTLGTEKICGKYKKVISGNTHHIKDKNIGIVDMSSVFAEAMYRDYMGESISELFK